MAKVIALTRGYIGGIVREHGEAFSVDDEIMDDPKRRPKWVKLAKPEHAQEAETGEGDGGKGEGAHDEDADKPKKGKGGRKAKAETIHAPEAKPFADAPAPVRAKSEVNDALGTTQPDWLAPGGAPQAVTD